MPGLVTRADFEQLLKLGTYEKMAEFLDAKGMLRDGKVDDPFPNTLVWLTRHVSHSTERVQRIKAIFTPNKPQVCQNCKWPGCIANLCDVCCSMFEAASTQKGLLEAHEEWRIRRRMMGLL